MTIISMFGLSYTSIVFVGVVQAGCVPGHCGLLLGQFITMNSGSLA